MRYTYWNKASEVLFGISADEALGKTAHELFPGEENRKVAGFYLEVMRKQEPDTLVSKYLISGKVRVFEINAYPTEDGLAVFGRDITDQRTILSRLEGLNRCFLGLGASPLSNMIKIVNECRDVMDAYAARYCRTESS